MCLFSQRCHNQSCLEMNIIAVLLGQNICVCGLYFVGLLVDIYITIQQISKTKTIKPWLLTSSLFKLKFYEREKWRPIYYYTITGLKMVLNNVKENFWKGKINEEESKSYFLSINYGYEQYN